MSRIGKQPISIPSGITVSVTADEVQVQGASDRLTVPVLLGIKVVVEDGEVRVTRTSELKQARANHGLVRSLIANHIEGLKNGYSKRLKLVGTGYRVASKGAGIQLSVGFSHPVDVVAPQGVKIDLEGNDTIIVSGVDKQKVGQLAAEIRKVRPPEPYKGKGIRYEDEVVRRKQGKAVAG